MPYHQFTIAVSDKFKEPLIRKLADLGSLGVIEDDAGVIAYFPFTLSRDAVLDELAIIKSLLEKSGGNEELTVSYTELQDADWNESWKKGFKPIDVGKHFTILPPWERQRTDRLNLIIDPGMAFGTGHHETTRSCLVLLEKYAEGPARGRFLDLGTGTGLLAIAAAKLGYKKVEGIDTDPLAIEASRKNIELNGSGGIVLREGDITAAQGGYDMITANLISGTLIELAGAISSRLNRSGIAILSGILKGQEGEVIAAMEGAGLRCSEKLVDGKWVTLACRR